MLFARKKNFKLHFQQYFLQPTSDSRQKQQEPDQTSFIIRGKWLAKSETWHNGKFDAGSKKEYCITKERFPFKPFRLKSTTYSMRTALDWQLL